jgi:hypothetical protein
MYTFDDNIVSDLHKDARGFRPDEYFWEEWTQMPDNIKQKIWDNLCVEMEQSMEQQKADEAAALVEFRKIVAAQMAFCNVSWNKAVEYLADAEGDDVDCEQGFDYFLWKQGIGYEDRLKIRKLYKEEV